MDNVLERVACMLYAQSASSEATPWQELTEEAKREHRHEAWKVVKGVHPSFERHHPEVFNVRN